ncbi:MAG: ParB/RepB/Spo0J family partition protein [Provencibacterium sp.]|jgi:ParB family chromosome partitioning protein|nr:ParB/RepB/Spo0J family partition protein [Provencibacterium sp.]
MSERIVNQVVLIPVQEVYPNPDQPRRDFSEEGLAELAGSIQQNGLLQPISVRRMPKGYELIAGERRLRAFKRLGNQEIPAIVENMDALTSSTLALIENLQRADLNCFEQAYAIGGLMKAHGVSQSEIAQKLGMAQSTVANKLRLLRLSPEARAKILEYGLTERHARCLLKLETPEAQLEAIEHICRRTLNVAQSERYIADLLEKQRPRQTRMLILKDVRLFINTINKAVETMKQAGINAKAERDEDGDFICFTVRIPKKSAVQNEKRLQPKLG